MAAAYSSDDVDAKHSLSFILKKRRRQDVQEPREHDQLLHTPSFERGHEVASMPSARLPTKKHLHHEETREWTMSTARRTPTAANYDPRPTPCDPHYRNDRIMHASAPATQQTKHQNCLDSPLRIALPPLKTAKRPECAAATYDGYVHPCLPRVQSLGGSSTLCSQYARVSTPPKDDETASPVLTSTVYMHSPAPRSNQHPISLQSSPASAASPIPHSAAPVPTSVDKPTATSTKRRASGKRPMTAEEKRRARECTVEGCSNYTIDRGLCFRHGGGKTCTIEGCTASAKSRGFCWKHGGSIPCTVEGCTRGAKSRGLCWSHGGGTKCSIPGCEKTTISKKLCWTHGGGKRCSYYGCKRPASTKEHNFCPKHRKEVDRVDYVFEV